MHQSLGNLEITVVAPVATYQGEIFPCITSERQISGEFFEVRDDTIYHPGQSLYVRLSPEGMAKARNLQAIRVSSRTVS